MSNMHNFIRRVTNAGLNIKTVYDIGAFYGTFSQSLRSVLPNAEYILFEANPAYNDILASTGFKYFNTLLSNPGRDYVEFYNARNTGDSYYKENTIHYDNRETLKLPCHTLDNLIAEHNLPIPNFIKLDTQGSELDILAGASFLDQVDLIQTECPIVCYNSGAPNIQDYIDYFKKNNFVPIDIVEIHRGEDILIQIDIMFMKHSTKEKYLGPGKDIRPLI